MKIVRPSLAITALALTGATTITACTTTTNSTQPTGPGGSTSCFSGPWAAAARSWSCEAIPVSGKPR
jgi:hypothetical protein